MESPTQASPSVSANDPEFFRAELDAFVAMNKRQRPAAWACVERLKQVCRSESPATPAGLDRSVRALAERTAA